MFSNSMFGSVNDLVIIIATVYIAIVFGTAVKFYENGVRGIGLILSSVTPIMLWIIVPILFIIKCMNYDDSLLKKGKFIIITFIEAVECYPLHVGIFSVLFAARPINLFSKIGSIYDYFRSLFSRYLNSVIDSSCHHSKRICGF